ncbi:hypothetical protein RFI_05612 [Reticulomyxa filosa]|uniref:Uncharacterized protein n=1 Tax=Reticulomyxa filosa TaxID=46433 RepID=X6NZU9_RETFI|nr:hypothetical protein RFI_05612 [Reticulomyxa filosa]|eukprot:ETO31506.1 hypothetical protein RFI_05612 [Reticulomyxa filosa]
MSLFKAFVNDGPTLHTIMLSELTIKQLKQQILQATQPTHVDDILATVVDGDSSLVETDEDVIQAFYKDLVYFTVQFRSAFSNVSEVVEQKEFEKRITLSSYKVRRPLVLLAGTLKYEQQQYLKDVKHDLHLLQTLFQLRFGHQVFNTYNPNDPMTESLTLSKLDNFILQQCSNLTDCGNNNSIAYDGLIFVWCGGGEAENILITSDNKIKDLREIKNNFIAKTNHFIGKPKIFIKITYKGVGPKSIEINEAQKKIWYEQDADMFTIYANITESSGSHFAKVFCQVIEANVNDSLEYITRQVIKILLPDQMLEKEIVQTISTTYSDIYLIPQLLKQQIQNACIKYEQSIFEKERPLDTLDFKKHWNTYWRKSNTEAAKIVEQMLRANEQGLIIVAYNTSKWKNKNDNLSSIASLLKNNKDDIKEFKEYIMYIIIKKEIVLEEVNIDGNVYAVDCKIECKGHVNITTQLFVTNNAIIDQQLKQTISPIEWNTKAHHDIPVQLQDLENKEEECTNKKLFDDSIIYLQQYLQVAMDIFSHNHPHVVVAHNLLGFIYNYKEQHEKAIESFEKAIALILSSFDVNCSFVAQLYENLGNIYNKKGYYDETIKCCTKSLEIRLEVFGTNHVSVAWSYTNLGDIYQNIKKYDKAIEYYESALKIRLDIFGNKHADVAWTYNNLGNACKSKEMYERAMEYYEMALQIRLEIFGNNHVDTSDSYCRLGGLYFIKGQYDKAIECYEKELHIHLNNSGDHVRIRAVYSNLGLTYFQKGNYDKAIELHEKAFKIRLDTSGVDSCDAAASYFDFACVYHRKKEYDKAIEHYEKSLKIRLEIFGSNHIDVSHVYNNLGNVYQCKQDYDKAIECYENAIKIRSFVLGNSHASVANSYTSLGIAYEKKIFHDKAIECYENALTIRKTVFGNANRCVADSYWNLGLISARLGNTKTACKYFEESWRVYSAVLGEWNKETLQAKRKLK